MLLSDLPTELVEKIASHADEKDLAALRLTSSIINKKTTDTCGARLFTHLRTDLSRRHLDRMIELGKDQELAKKVRILRIMPPRSQATSYGAVYGEGFDWPRDKPAAPGQLGHLGADLEGYERLVHVLQHSLPRCRKFDLSTTCSRVGLLSTLDLIFLIQQLMSKAAITDVELAAFLSRATEANNEFELLPAAVLSRPMRPGALESWASMKSLGLVKIPRWLVEQGWLRSVLSLASGLDSLRLDFFPVGVDGTDVLPYIHFGKARILHLGTMHLGEPLLKRTVDSFSKNLASLQLKNTILECQSEPQVWLTYLKRIRTMAPNLRTLALEGLVARTPDRNNIWALHFADFPGMQNNEQWKQERSMFVFDGQYLQYKRQCPSTPEVKLDLGTSANGLPAIGGRTLDMLSYTGSHMDEVFSLVEKYGRLRKVL